jgi:hypothetical protein
MSESSDQALAGDHALKAAIEEIKQAANLCMDGTTTIIPIAYSATHIALHYISTQPWASQPLSNSELEMKDVQDVQFDQIRRIAQKKFFATPAEGADSHVDPQDHQARMQQQQRELQLQQMKLQQQQAEWQQRMFKQPQLPNVITKKTEVKKVVKGLKPSLPEAVAKMEIDDKTKAAYKTRMCQHKDACTVEDCTYAHTVKELCLREVSTNFKMSVCKNYPKCAYNYARCNYYHNNETERRYGECNSCSLIFVDDVLVAKICRVKSGEPRICDCV